MGWLPPSGTPPPEATGSVPLWRRLPIGWIIFVVLIAGGAIGGWYFNAGRSSTGELNKTGDLQAVELKVGDCFDLKDPSADEVNDVTAGPCTTEHEFELFFVGALPEGEYPADDVFDQYVIDNCNSAFTTYVGTAYDASELDIYWLVPTDDAWRAGDRTVQCARVPPAGPSPDPVRQGLEPVGPQFSGHPKNRRPESAQGPVHDRPSPSSPRRATSEVPMTEPNEIEFHEHVKRRGRSSLARAGILGGVAVLLVAGAVAVMGASPSPSVGADPNAAASPAASPAASGDPGTASPKRDRLGWKAFGPGPGGIGRGGFNAITITAIDGTQRLAQDR